MIVSIFNQLKKLKFFIVIFFIFFHFSSLNAEVKFIKTLISSTGSDQQDAIDKALFEALSQMSKEKPSVAVLGETATSGGYLIAVATDKIISRSNTLTGSIGVILQYPNLSKFLKKVGIDINT